MKKRMNKEASILYESVIFLTFTAVIAIVLILFISLAGDNVTNTQQVYAKQISLLIDQAKPGTNLTIDISELYKLAEKRDYEGRPIDVDYGENLITVKVAEGRGYSFRYFTDLKSGAVSMDERNKLLRVRV